MTALFWLLALLNIVLAAPSCSGGSCLPHVCWQKRQTLDLVQTQAQISTETSTTMESTAPLPTASLTLAGVQPQVHFVGNILATISDAESILFLPYGSPTSGPPTDLSPTLASDTLTSSMASEAVTFSLTSTDSSAPSETVVPPDSNTIDASSSSYVVNPALALQTPIIKGPLVSAYYPDWAASVLPPEKIDMTRLDWIDFAFAMPDASFSLVWDDPTSSPGILTRLVSAAHAKSTKVKLSIGGWDGSTYFSSACATVSSRKTFVSNIVALYNQFHLDGVDIDWEYPGLQGEGSNVVSPQDSANFLAMLKLLRSYLPKAARITAAVQDTPFVDANGNPMKDVSAFAAVLDWVNIMNYDIFSSSSKPGPNAPLFNGCHDSSQPDQNAAAAIAAWSAAKFPAARLMLGVPAYGYLNPSHATTLVHKRALSSLEPLLLRQSTDATAGIPGTALVALKSADGTTNSGQIQFNALVAQGALVPARVGGSSASTFVGFGGFTRLWDACSSTPFLTSPYTNQVVTYDDPQSLALKAVYARQAKILGTAMWDLSGDTAEWDLTNALRQGLGKST